MYIIRLLERNETRRVGGTNTRATVTDGLVGDGELTKVVSDHLRLDFHSVEGNAVVNSDHASHHLRDNDGITKVSAHNLGLFTLHGFSFSLSQLLGQDVVLAGKSALEQSSSLTGVDEVSELLVGDFHQGIKIDTSVGELLKGSLLSRHVCVGGAKKKKPKTKYKPQDK